MRDPVNNEQFERLMRDAAETYNRPPVAPVDEMWAAIEAETFGVSIAPPRKRSLAANPWLRMAAVLVLGVVLGRASTLLKSHASGSPTTAANEATGAPAADPYSLVTNRYLGEAVTLLVALPKQLDKQETDSAFVGHARDLLATTRMLMDSPTASDPRLRRLLDDLELVLVQVVQMPRARNASEAKLIRQALSERDVLPRLRDAVADNPN